MVNRFLIGQPYGASSNPGTQAVGAEGFHRCFAEGLNQSSVSSVTQATQPLVRTGQDNTKANIKPFLQIDITPSENRSH